MAAEINWPKTIAQAAARAPQTYRRDFRVSRKGCGRGSGEAPRALKLVLLNRIANHVANDIVHAGGDGYRLSNGFGEVPFVFRITTARRLGETGRPWFNLSAPELANYKAGGAVIVVAECKNVSDSALAQFASRIFVIAAADLPDIAAFATKPSEPVPTALFEIRTDEAGPFLFNLTAKDNYPSIRLQEGHWAQLEFTPEETDLIRTGYETIWVKDPTMNGAFEPLQVTVDAGDAPPEEVAEYLASLSQLYRMLGGSGITFTMTDARFPALVEA